MSAEPWRCPRCGSDAGCDVKFRLSGFEWCRVTADGVAEIISDDGKRVTPAAKGMCRNCGNHVPRPPWEGDTA